MQIFFLFKIMHNNKKVGIKYNKLALSLDKC